MMAVLLLMNASCQLRGYFFKGESDDQAGDFAPEALPGNWLLPNSPCGLLYPLLWIGCPQVHLKLKTSKDQVR